MKPLHNKKLFIFFVLVTYIIIPFVDSVACDDCINPAFLSRGIEIGYLNLSHANTLSISDSDTDDNKPSSQKGIKYSCSICFNTAKMVSAYDIKTIFSPVSIAFQSAFLTLLEPVFPINKPPHN